MVAVRSFFRSTSESPYRTSAIALGLFSVMAVVGFFMPDAIGGLLLLVTGFLGAIMSVVAAAIVAVSRHFGLDERAEQVVLGAHPDELGFTFATAPRKAAEHRGEDAIRVTE